MAIYISIDDLLEGAEIDHIRHAFAEWRQALASHPPRSVVFLGEGIHGTRVTLDHGYHRYLSAWLLGRLLDAGWRSNIAVAGESGDFRRLHQFVDIPARHELYAVASGDDALPALETLVLGAVSFDPSKFDSDGYAK